MKLVPCPLSYVHSVYPLWYNKDAFYYTVTVARGGVGLYAIKPLGSDTCEISLLAHVPFLTKERCHALIEYPFKMGFKNVIIGTKLRGIIALQARFGFKDMGCDNVGKHWFIREGK